MKDLYESLREYTTSGTYPFHMPGHKRNTANMPDWNPWLVDVTEVEGTDNLHHAEGILKQAMERGARISGAAHTYFLVNGSTGGILSAVAAVTRPGDTVLVARNCHKSVYHALALNHLRAVYLYPEWIEEYHMAGGISPEKVEALLGSNPQIRAVILTSPTYEGVVSDIGRIAEAAHKRGLPLIVDEAHGAHFGQAGFPASAVRYGADIVIQSCHKTLPALTQTGLLQLCGTLADRDRLEECLGIYQTSSPSYVLMASIDYALAFLESGQEEMRAYEERLLALREKISSLSYIALPGRELVGKSAVYDVDNSKLVLSVCGKPGAGIPGGGREQIWNGRDLYECLRLHYGIQCEMAMEGYALAMTSVMDTGEGFARLWEALEEIDRQMSGEGKKLFYAPASETSCSIPQAAGQAYMTITEAQYARKQSCPWKESEGKISGEYLYLYPPGTPLLVPGEEITAELIERAGHLQRLGFELQGLKREGEIQICITEHEKEGRDKWERYSM